MYTYKAKVINVYDGDTVTLLIDLGFNIQLEVKARLYGLNAPEVRGKSRPLGLTTRDKLRQLIDQKEVQVRSFNGKQGKFGRWIVEIWLDSLNINNFLITRGFAKRADY